MSAVVQFTRTNQRSDFSDLSDAAKRLARCAVTEALEAATSRYPQTYRNAAPENKIIAGSSLAIQLLEQAMVEVRTTALGYLALKEIAD